METDVLHSVLKKIDYSRWTVLGLVVATVVTIALLGCNPTMPGLTIDAKPVSQDVFMLQAENAKTDLASRVADWENAGKKLEIETNALAITVGSINEGFAKKFEWRQKIVDAVGGVIIAAASGGTIGIGSIAATFVPLAIGLAGAGAYRDKKRTDGELAAKKAENKTA